MFADDTGLFFHGQLSNLHKAKEVLDTYCMATGANINIRKSHALWIVREPRPWTWEADGLKWLSPGQAIDYLGSPFGFFLPRSIKDSKVLSQVWKHLLEWSPRRLSIVGRILVSNQVLLASLINGQNTKVSI